MKSARGTSTSDEQLLAHAVADPDHFDEWTKLLSRFWHGFPAERLRQLLMHNHRDAVLGGLFIVDELYERAHPVLGDVITLAGHVDARIRSSAYYAISSCARRGRESAFVYVLRGLRDPDPTCRIVAMMLAARVPNTTLAAAIPMLADAETNIREGIRWLQSGALLDPPHISASLHSEDAVDRRFAAIAAARDPSLWRTLPELVASCVDADICEFAADYVKFKTGLLEREQRLAEARSGNGSRWRKR